MKRYDVVALGELLIDFTQNGFSEQGNPLFEANPGGAPCNVLSMLTKLNRKTAFIGKVGDDGFGRQLECALLEVGIDTINLKFDKEVHTTLAIVQTKEDGDRDFSFYRKPGADMMLKKEEVSETLIKDARVFHFGTLSMTDSKNREATKYAVKTAEEAGNIITFDPNIRLPLWDSKENLKNQMIYGMQHCHVLKISDDEIQWFTGIEDYEQAAAFLYETYQIPLILVTLGKKGSIGYYNRKSTFVKAFSLKGSIETTGAGDTFMACVIHKVLEIGLENFDNKSLIEMLSFANAAAAYITTKKGALRVMPEMENIISVERGIIS